MTDPAPDPVGEMLNGLRIPSPSPDLIERIMAEAQRADRVPAPAALPPPRRPRPRRWTRRGVWTAVLAINLAVASAVAAAIGSGAIDGSRLIVSARHAIERLAHPHVAARAKHVAPYPHPPSPPPRSAPPQRFVEAARPLAEQSSAGARPLPARTPETRVIPTRAGRARNIAHRAVLHAAQRQLARPVWRQRPMAGAAARSIEPERSLAREERRARFGTEPGFGRPGFYRRRFDGPRLGRFGGRPAKFRGGGGGRRWGMRHGGPRRRF